MTDARSNLRDTARRFLLVIKTDYKLIIFAKAERDFQPSGEISSFSDHLRDVQQGHL